MRVGSQDVFLLLQHVDVPVKIGYQLQWIIISFPVKWLPNSCQVTRSSFPTKTSSLVPSVPAAPLAKLLGLFRRLFDDFCKTIYIYIIQILIGYCIVAGCSIFDLPFTFVYIRHHSWLADILQYTHMYVYVYIYIYIYVCM